MNRTEATQILMLNSDATFDDVKYAYRKLSLKLHPDRNKNEKDGRRFKNVLEAYHFLKGQNKLKNHNSRNKSTQTRGVTLLMNKKKSSGNPFFGFLMFFSINLIFLFIV